MKLNHKKFVSYLRKWFMSVDKFLFDFYPDFYKYPVRINLQTTFLEYP